MTACPFATWDPLGPQTEPAMRAHDIVCLHTMAGPFAVVNRMFHDNGYGGTESHFGIAGDGRARQWQNLEFQADANLKGNPRVISIETADMGEDFEEWTGSNVPPWTPNQLDRIVQIVDWCCAKYSIPRVLVPDSKPGRRGIAYHRQGINPWRVSGGELWSDKTGKVCPGDKRIAQVKSVIIPRLQLTESDDMDEIEYRKELKDGESRTLLKAIATGAVLDGLREKDATHPDRGALREPLKDILREVLAEVAVPGGG